MKKIHLASKFLRGPSCTTAAADPLLADDIRDVTCRACVRAEIRHRRSYRGASNIGDPAVVAEYGRRLREAVDRLKDLRAS